LLPGLPGGRGEGVAAGGRATARGRRMASPARQGAIPWRPVGWWRSSSHFPLRITRGTQGSAHQGTQRYAPFPSRARARCVPPRWQDGRRAAAPLSVAILKTAARIPISVGREARPRRHPRSPDSNAVRVFPPTGRAQAGRHGTALPITGDAWPPSRAAPDRAQGRAVGPSSPSSSIHRGGAPAAPSLAPLGPGTAHPALRRPLLRTLPCQRWQGGGDDEAFPAPPGSSGARPWPAAPDAAPARAIARAGPYGWTGMYAGSPCAALAPSGPVAAAFRLALRGRLGGGPAFDQRSAPARPPPRGRPGQRLPPLLQPVSAAPKPTVAVP
jgi:hypothetical protein